MGFRGFSIGWHTDNECPRPKYHFSIFRGLVMWLHVATRPRSAGWRKSFSLAASGAQRVRWPFPWARVFAAKQGARLLLSVRLAALGWLAIGGAALAAERAIRPSGSSTPAILVAPGPGGVAISSEDTQALDRFAELLAALASVRASAKEETVVFYLKHAKAGAVGEILEAVFAGGSLAEEPLPAAPLFGGFGPPGTAMAGGWPAGPSAGRTGVGFPFRQDRENGIAPNRGSAQGTRGPVPRASGGTAGFRSGGASGQSGSGVHITADSRLNALIVQAKPGDMDIVEELVKILDQQGTPEEVAAEPRPRVIAVRHVAVQSVLGVLRQVYQDRLTNGGATAGPGGWGGPDQVSAGQGPGGPGFPGFPQPSGGPGAAPAQFFQQLAMAAGGSGRRGRAGLGTEELPKMALGADTRSNSLVVVAPDRVFKEVRELVRQLDRPAADNAEAIQVLALRSGNTELVRRALPAFMGDRVRVSQASAASHSNLTTEGAAPGGWRQRGMPRGDTQAEPQVPATNDRGALEVQSPGMPTPPTSVPSATPSAPAGGFGQNGFGRAGPRGPGEPGVPSFPGDPVSAGGPTATPMGGEALPPQPVGPFPFQGSPNLGPREVPALGGPEPGMAPPPGPLP